MAFNYVVTANRATAVAASTMGNFTGPNDLNLITARASRIEVTLVTPDGLRQIQEINVNGQIEVIKILRPYGYNKDLLFFMTGKYHVAILECLQGPNDTYEIVTRRSGNIADHASVPVEMKHIVIVDPNCRMIGLRLYNGLFKVIPIDSRNKSSDLEAFNIRMEENVVPDITFLHGQLTPTIAYIHKDMSGICHLRTMEISLKDKDANIGSWHKESIANEASFLIPVSQPFGGVIAIALESIAYMTNGNEKAIAPPLIKQAPIQCYASIDREGSRYLLGDLAGRLFCLILEAEDYRLSDKLEVKDLRLELIGEVSIPDTITYLDNSMVFIGSKFGDSQLIKLLSTPDDNGSLIQICETYTNLGPIMDMCLVDLEKQGQGQLVTCSGHSKDGTLRVIRNGIGLNEKSSLDYSHMKGIWPLKLGKNQTKDNHLLVTFILDSFLWRCSDDGDFMNCQEEDGFDRNSRTVACANVRNNLVIQVTRKSINLIDAITKERVDTWVIPNNHEIYRVTHTQDVIIVAERKDLYIIDIGQRNMKFKSKYSLESEIACMDLNPITTGNNVLAVGFWFNTNIVLYNLDQFRELHREQLDSEICMTPRSILTIKLDDNYYLLCALGDGSVYYFNLEPTTGALSNVKKVTLGTYETILTRFKSQSTSSIFVCSDRPTVIYSTNNKLVFSNVNLKEVNFMCTIDSQHYPDSLALVSDSDLLLGTIDEIQKLHIRTIPLNEAPLKIAHQPSTQTLGLLTSRIDIQNNNGYQPPRQSVSTMAHNKSYASSTSTGAGKPPGLPCSDLTEIETCSLLIIDQHTFDVLHAHQFMPLEVGVTILSTKLGETEEEYFVVGTGFVHLDEPEPKQGRLIVFKWTSDQNLQQVAELSVKGSPYSLCEFGNKFLAGVSSSVHLVELNSRRDLHVECTTMCGITCLFLKRRGHNILMGDLMRSMSLIAYKPLEAHFEEVARDYNPAWMTEVEMLDDDHYLGFEQSKNAFVCARGDSKAANEQDRQQMVQVGVFHLGDLVNVCIPGSLVVQHPSERSIDIKRSTLFGTLNGVIGLIMTIDEPLFRKLESVQNALCRTIKSAGKIDHKEWRTFQANKSTIPCQGFIDGDLVENFLDLKRAQMESLAKDTGIPVEELVKLIEELSRLH